MKTVRLNHEQAGAREMAAHGVGQAGGEDADALVVCDVVSEVDADQAEVQLGGTALG